MSIPHWAQPVNPPRAPTPEKKNNNTLWITIVAVLAVLVVLALCLIGGTLLLLRTGDDVGNRVVQPSATTAAFTEDDAKRECYSAFRTEFEQRDQARDDQDGVFATVQEIEVLDSQQYQGDYVVNGTVHYSLNTGGTAVSDTLDLTCTASQTSDGTVLTDVENRT